MPEHLPLPTPPIGPASSDEDHGGLRILSRSPHPYHRLNTELLEPSDRFTYPGPTAASDGIIDGNTDGLNASNPSLSSAQPFPAFARDSPLTSESGTEADDEHFLKGLPAPKVKSHKGLRGRNEVLSGTSTPLPSPAVLEEEGRKKNPTQVSHHAGGYERNRRSAADRVRRRKELIRRATEVLLLVCQGGMVASNPDARPFLRLYQKELQVVGGVFCGLAAAYPLRLIAWAYRQGKPQKLVPIRVPTSFDPAPLLYPPLVPLLVTLLIAPNVRGAVIPSLVLSISTLPRPLIPGARHWDYFNSQHWLLSCMPFTLDALISTTQTLSRDEIPREVLVLLYPLHQTLCLVLHHLTTTSLLVSELQLLSASLISLFLLASSPQAVILKTVLWGGGLGIAVLCSKVIQWGVSLARVPKWRFRRAVPFTKEESKYERLRQLLSFRRHRSGSTASYRSVGSNRDDATDEEVDRLPSLPRITKQTDSLSDTEPVPNALGSRANTQGASEEPLQQNPIRRHTLPLTGQSPAKPKTTTTINTTPSGRRKRATSSSARAFFSLTHSQATLRKWLYAGYVYFCLAFIILIPVRLYIQNYALEGHEPIGWALAYLFGDLPQFRFQVVKANLERWIPLPPLLRSSPATCDAAGTTDFVGGWINHIRLTSFGPGTTRLILSAYFATTILAGLAVVFQLSPVFEVDTRRKVFHFMMVAMFLPAAYVDPCYIALALALMLAIFLALDLLRASQLPPLSRPIARFLTPYVDGRDLRGPVVVSHIFLLIGCAIPLWLSLASLPRSSIPTEGTSPSSSLGWELPVREIAMVSGVICVGLGDAAASLVGRRWGHRKWLWGGGKSLEGSAAFAVAVFGGLMVAGVWLRIGGWAVSSVDNNSSINSMSAGLATGSAHAQSGMDSLMSVLDPRELGPWMAGKAPRAAVCATLASLTEAVLTGGNDNVVVPVVLWGCVKSLGI